MNFAEISRNLARYSSESNFVDYQNNCGMFKLWIAKFFEALLIVFFLHNYFDGSTKLFLDVSAKSFFTRIDIWSGILYLIVIFMNFIHTLLYFRITRRLLFDIVIFMPKLKMFHVIKLMYN